ncbi:50S ribosomal protein l9 [Phtheirospermum japonicum]|uniref:Large ribosomal subunit protein bL9c n=1 Tax=Phtheirospermum japonicum TaxID=374723 RepID=A0A830BZJ8_9LAMI|nr:50S ribosomal protein l9 [Phtheirospermum japonicum]
MACFHYGKNVLRRNSMHHPLLFAAQGVRYRKLEVILTTSIEKLGKAGETVKVAPGYFRNYLMPKLLAVPNIDKFAHLIREQRKIYEPKEVEAVKVVSKSEGTSMKEYEAAANRLVSTRLVARQLQVQIQPENLYLPDPLSSLGEFKVPLRLPKAIPKPVGDEWILNIKIRKR